ncbi:hypothetical protein JAAARDRAFT_64581 [Jaapia argillacea MUCL 33604]|uniref:BZIP domain-containing protein n=1 Tax=Jaapia argillacea MUCL 33604 TaxID=933084 RepID=A0A067QCE9_9AGAM|nr:hypothetical protein JAAARDRAFT_64581 [Jaapia argillacea MUCL 33604]
MAGRDRSESHEVEQESDVSSPLDPNETGTPQAGKPGRKKNPNSQAARRDQNRIAQREFRLRKQQRIRDLEARVELLSGGKDEALGEMRGMLKDLMHENQVLRNLLKSLSSFIGEGAGGLLPKLGWDLADFNSYVNKAETDTAWESFQKRKKKRPAEDGPNPSSSKRPREDDQDAERDNDGYPMMVPMNSAVPPPPNNSYSQTKSPHDNSFFNDLIRHSAGSPMFLSQPSAGQAPPHYNPPPSSNSQNSYQAPYLPNLNINVDSSLPPLPFVPNAALPIQQQPHQRATPQTPHTPDEEIDDDPKKQEAYKLIHYHLDNYKRNSAYCLPSSLRPTLVQRTVPHESAIDRIPHPELRDRMILLRGRYDLVDCLHDYRASVTIHGDDVLAHSNWEIGDVWLNRYGFLVEQATLNIANRWRRERGEGELRLSDLAPPEQHSTSV